MSYDVQLEVFEGPLDLLLQLVSKDRVDISEVSISSITRDYLDTVRKMEEIDLDVASAFLVIAATLLELKSMKLLPKSESDPEVATLLEERDHLLHRLIEYSTFKRVAEALRDLFDQNVGHFTRTASLPPEFVEKAPDLLAGVSASMLRDYAADALAPRGEIPVDTSFMTPMRVSVGEMVEALTEQIQLRGTTSFRELCSNTGQRIEVVVRFLALLELFKSQSVEVEQARPFGEIVIRWRRPMTTAGAGSTGVTSAAEGAGIDEGGSDE